LQNDENFDQLCELHGLYWNFSLLSFYLYLPSFALVKDLTFKKYFKGK
jgi:hypothetical protein